MKKVSIIGSGMGPDTVTEAGRRAIAGADMLIGARRLLQYFAQLNKPLLAQYEPQQVAQSIRDSAGQNFAILVSGDVGFFSAAPGLLQALDFCQVELIAGVSSLNYFFARLQRPWQEAAVLSCHGRQCNPADTVRRNRLSFILTGDNTAELAAQLEQAGFGHLPLTVGENLGQASERIFTCPVSELSSHSISSLAVLLIENDRATAQVPCGIADRYFVRGDVPMTKAEVRAVIMSKLQLSPEAVCLDVGAGTGSVTVEMALAAWRGKVFAVEKNEQAVPLITQNCRRFHLGNVCLVKGTAPQALAELPAADAAFIGGSNRRLAEIVTAIYRKNPAVRLVISAIAIESAQQAIAALQALDLSPELVQVAISRTQQAGGLHLLCAQNPIFIISGGGGNER